MKRTRSITADAERVLRQRPSAWPSAWYLLIDDMVSLIASELVAPADYFALARIDTRTARLLHAPALLQRMTQLYFEPWQRVMQDYLNLRIISVQTPELCLAAVQKNGRALEFVKKRTPEVFLAAVQQNGRAVEFVKEQTPELCLAAVQQNPSAIKFVENPTPELRAAAGMCLCGNKASK